MGFFSDLAMVQAARAAGEASTPVRQPGVRLRPPGLRKSWPKFDAQRAAHGPLRRQAGAALAKDRAAQALTQVMIPEALDYPL